MTNVPLTLVLSILNVLECQGYPLSSIRYVKQIEYDKRATYIGTIHSKCFRVSEISVVFEFYKITYMKEIEYDKHAIYIGIIHSKCFI